MARFVYTSIHSRGVSGGRPILFPGYLRWSGPTQKRMRRFQKVRQFPRHMPMRAVQNYNRSSPTFYFGTGVGG